MKFATVWRLEEKYFSKICPKDFSFSLFRHLVFFTSVASTHHPSMLGRIVLGEALDGLRISQFPRWSAEGQNIWRQRNVPKKQTWHVALAAIFDHFAVENLKILKYCWCFLFQKNQRHTLSIYIFLYIMLFEKGEAGLKKMTSRIKGRLYSGSHSASHLGSFSIFFNEVDYVVDTVTESADEDR